MFRRLIAWWQERQAQQAAQQAEGIRRDALKALLDTTLDDDTREEAAWYLSNFHDPEVEQAVLLVASDHSLDAEVAERCGYTLASLWSGKPALDVAALRQLHPVALEAFAEWLVGINPEWDLLLRDLVREAATSRDG